MVAEVQLNYPSTSFGAGGAGGGAPGGNNPPSSEPGIRDYILSISGVVNTGGGGGHDSRPQDPGPRGGQGGSGIVLISYQHINT